MLDADAFDRDRMTRDIETWAAVESPTVDRPGVNRMMDLAAERMAALGARITRFPGADGFGDAVRADFDWADGAPVMVLGHLDTVHMVGTLDHDLPLRRESGRLYGPGVLDMKGGVIASIHAIDQVIRRHGPLSVPLSFLFIPDEEMGSPSTRTLIEREAAGCRAVLVPEPGRVDRLVTGRHAFLRYTLRITGAPAHAGVARTRGVSAIRAMARLIDDLEAGSDLEREVTYRVGIVSGGTFVNVVPTECTAQVLCVAPTPEAFAEVQARMAGLQPPDPSVTLTVEPGPVRPLFQGPPGTMALFETAQRLGRELDLDFAPGQFGGGSDGNFTGALGIPTLDGLGVRGDGIHTKQEYVALDSLVPCARLLSGLYLEIARQAAA